jgi:hypothetical protein
MEENELHACLMAHSISDNDPDEKITEVVLFKGLHTSKQPKIIPQVC